MHNVKAQKMGNDPASSLYEIIWSKTKQVIARGLSERDAKVFTAVLNNFSPADVILFVDSIKNVDAKKFASFVVSPNKRSLAHV